jgi:hypothetical protein
MSEDIKENNVEKVEKVDSELNRPKREYATDGFTPKSEGEISTYIEIISEKDENGQPISVLEVDLVISREKGKETRRLSLNFSGIDMVKQEMIEKSVDIDRDNFERLKHFFCNLDWDS